MPRHLCAAHFHSTQPLDSEKAESEKVETEKVAAQKVETEKVESEKVDAEEVAPDGRMPIMRRACSAEVRRISSD